ncbi:hypothetical protein EYZ11_011780 [Aspergillus tanneri]|uniref:Uncharacterized protein n=1 Tax=Aspergillus tanneri TaxID=1220188 RepID=A0A4V3UMV4_9EURO|nr:uncharacterized protein ATNIH1004_007240 [Aspergillus tanneri]KAA8645819.1 hypothetical protein ATNIH1004_007240 [Aspergillus tanneri]THC88774.1 hypothetical protein EYZ11_011780 [Aspergillus tanneri]
MAANSMVFTTGFGPKEAVDYFRSLLTEEVSEAQVYESNRYLLKCVHSGAITPKIFTIWLFLAHSRFPSILQSALRDRYSRGVRQAGINVFKCAMKTDNWWEKGWNALGGTTCLKEIFEELSLQEAKMLARAIGVCSNAQDASKSQAVNALLQLLIPNFFESASAQVRSSSSRQLLGMNDLAPLFNASSDTTLVKAFSTDRPDDFINPLIRALLNSHMPLLREIVVGSVPAYPPLRRRLLHSHLSAILTSSEPYEPKISRGWQAPIPAMGVALDLIESVRGKSAMSSPVSWDTQILCIGKTLTIARRLKVPFDQILALLERVLPVLDHSQRHLHEWTPLIHGLIRFWGMAAFPAAYIESSSNARAARHREALHPSRPQKAHKDSLEILLRMIFGTMLKTELTSCIVTLFSYVVEEAKLPLLKIICKHLRGLEIDLDQPTPSKNEDELLPWNTSFLMSLSGQDARWLFERAARLSPTKCLLTTIPFDRPPAGEDSSSFQESLFQVHLESTNKEQVAGNGSVTLQFIEHVKLKAVKARDANDRLQWARLTISIAVMSKDVKILKDVIYWTSRFLRDPFVGPSLASKTYEAGVASVLSCVALSTLRHLSSREELEANVGIADAVLHHLIEQALLVLHEPWYKSFQEGKFGGLLKLIVSYRIDAVDLLCQRGLGTEKEVVASLFDKLVPILLEYESVGITEGYESLGWGRLDGPLENIRCPQKQTTEVLRLLDSLAQQRDCLWARQRLLRNPQTASFPEGLPRGLPLQYLFPSKRWTMAVMKSKEVGSFITERVREVVFCDANTILQKINQEDHRIGPFVDSLKFAIEIYIGEGPVEEQSARILEIWKHYSEKIPSSAGHTESFRSYLCSFARSRSLHKVARIIDPPQMPSLDIFQMSHDSLSFEWDPRSTDIRRSSPDHWEETLLQHQFFAIKQQGSLEAIILAYSHPNAWQSTMKAKAFNIWRPKYGPQRLSFQHGEALIVSALLFLNNLTRNSQRLLSKPFPEDSDILRYPPVHLDYEFLAAIGDQGEAADAALSVLSGLVRVVPPNLLYELSLSLLETLDELESTSPKYPLVQRCAYKTIALLRRSDKPQLAATLGMKALELFPKASSWHRMAFPSSLPKALSRKTAELTMRSFTSYIFEALRKQKTLAKDENASIKITTVKMLGTMLAENKFGMSPSFIVGALKDLFNASNHVDVRVTVCTALLSVLEKYDDADEAYEVFTSFASYAASPSENNESGSWLQSEQAQLPRVDSQRPLLELFTKTAYCKLPGKYLEQYTYKTLLPLVEESTRQHNRWMHQFLSPLELTSEELSVTDFGPFAADLIEVVMDLWSEYLPRGYLLKHRSWALGYLDCMKLRNINSKLTEQDRSWRTTNAGGHWREFFDIQIKTKSSHTLSWILQNGINSKVPNGITHEAIAEEIVERAAVFIRNPFKCVHSRIEVSLEPFTTMLSALQASDPVQRAKVLPTLERVIADVHGLRTVEWNNGTRRCPPILPPKLQLQTLLLPFPHFHKETPSRYGTFISRVLSLIEETASSPACIADRSFLLEAMDLVSKDDARQCALGFGRGYESSTNVIAQHLRVWLAQVLLLRFKLTKNERDAEVREMIFQWKSSSNESIRSIGWSTDPQAI